MRRFDTFSICKGIVHLDLGRLKPGAEVTDVRELHDIEFLPLGLYTGLQPFPEKLHEMASRLKLSPAKDQAQHHTKQLIDIFMRVANHQEEQIRCPELVP